MCASEVAKLKSTPTNEELAAEISKVGNAVRYRNTFTCPWQAGCVPHRCTRHAKGRVSIKCIDSMQRD